MAVTETSRNDRLRLLLVDPDEETRKRLRTVLEKDEAIGTIRECANAAECLSVIQSLQPDLVLLDVVLPDMSAFLLLGRIQLSPFPQIIFLARDHKFAARAFEVPALDYLLKPCEEERFKKAIARAKVEISRQRAIVSHRDREFNSTSKLIFNDGQRRVIVQQNELIYIEAQGKYVQLNFGGKSAMLKIPISHVERMLKSVSFVRIHRSVIVNTEHIRSLKPTPYRKTYDIVLKDGTLLSLSRKESLKRILQNK